MKCVSATQFSTAHMSRWHFHRLQSCRSGWQADDGHSWKALIHLSRHLLLLPHSWFPSVIKSDCLVKKVLRWETQSTMCFSHLEVLSFAERHVCELPLFRTPCAPVLGVPYYCTFVKARVHMQVDISRFVIQKVDMKSTKFKRYKVNDNILLHIGVLCTQKKIARVFSKKPMVCE